MTDSAARPSKEARVQRILAALSPRDREALHRFYTLHQDISQISRDLGLDERELQKLKSRVKKEFQAARWSQ